MTGLRFVLGLALGSYLLLSAAAAGLAQEKKAGEDDARKVLYTHLVTQAQQHFDVRRQELAALKTADEIKQRQAKLKEKFLASLGGFPEKSPLKAQTVGMLTTEGVRVEKVIFESRPNHKVTASLYLPSSGKGPFPGVIVPCGHDTKGKASDAYQRVSLLLAKHGIAALCYDPIGQGERFQNLTDKGVPVEKSTVGEHIQIGIGAWLTGQSTASYRIWDGMRALDYLQSRSEIDPKKLGCTGNSGGGTLTSYLMALDDRIVAAAPSCYLTSLEKLLATIGPQDAEQNIVGQIAFGMEHADYANLRAPLPTLFCVGTQDFFNIDGAWSSFREAKLLYGKLGFGERVELFEFDDKHGFSKPRREAATRWMLRWLLDKNLPVTEGAFSTFTDEQLQCTRTGQVLADAPGVSAFGLTQQECDKYRAERAKFASMSFAARDTVIRGALKLGKSSPKVELKAEAEGRFTVTPEAGLQLTLRQYSKPTEVAILALPEAHASKLLEKKDPLTEKYQAQFELNLRGMGGFVREAKPANYNPDFRYAMVGLMLDRPVLGQRVDELLGLIDALARQQGIKKFHLVGQGATGLVAWHAAALDPRIVEVTVEGGLASWEQVVRTPDAVGQIQNVVPGVLRKYDIPELLAGLALSKLTVVKPTNAKLQPLSADEAKQVLSIAKNVKLVP